MYNMMNDLELHNDVIQNLLENENFRAQYLALMRNEAKDSSLYNKNRKYFKSQLF